jgi:hypothetical protein
VPDEPSIVSDVRGNYEAGEDNSDLGSKEQECADDRIDEEQGVKINCRKRRHTGKTPIRGRKNLDERRPILNGGEDKRGGIENPQNESDAGHVLFFAERYQAAEKPSAFQEES